MQIVYLFIFFYFKYTKSEQTNLVKMNYLQEREEKKKKTAEVGAGMESCAGFQRSNTCGPSR